MREFVDAVERVAGGGTAIDPEVVAQLVTRHRRDDGPLDELTPREREVLELMAEGRSNAAIAAALVVTDGAVEKHISSDLRQARPAAVRHRPPPRAGGDRLPARLITGTGTSYRFGICTGRGRSSGAASADVGWS